MYDYLIVGAGLFGATFAQVMAEQGKKCLVIDKRSHIGGNCFTENREGIYVHIYGPHIFHTAKEHVWKYVNRFTSFNNFRYRVKSFTGGRYYTFPVNLATINEIYHKSFTPHQAKEFLKLEAKYIRDPQNFEEFCLASIGEKLYKTFFYGYTKKQWGKEPRDLPFSIAKRIPFRLDFSDSYYPEEEYQGIPVGGYTKMIENMLAGIEVRLNTDYFEDETKAKKIVFTGGIDNFFDYCQGRLEYRSLSFDHQFLNDTFDFQGIATINFPSEDTPHTRRIEHKHFMFGNHPYSIVTWEKPCSCGEPYYPVETEKNLAIYNTYREMAKKHSRIIFGGRLATYKYLNMDEVIDNALIAAQKELSECE